MHYDATPAFGDQDMILIMTCLALGAWGLFNYLKSIALLKLSASIKKHARDASDLMTRSNKTTLDMLDTGTAIQKQYLKLSALNIHYDEIASQNKYLNQLCPNISGKEGLIKDAAEEDTILHITIVGTGASIVLDNQVTLIYRKVEDRIDFYDKNKWCVMSANRIDHPDIFVWLNPYLSGE